LFKPRRWTKTWTKKYRKKVWIGYAIFSLVFSTILLLIAIYFYNSVVTLDWRRYFIFYLILGIIYVIVTISSLYLVLRLITSIKKQKKMISPSEVEERFFLEIEGMVNYYLQENEEEAYTAKALISRLENCLKDNKKLEYFRNNIEEILIRMVQRGTIQLVEDREGDKYSF